MRTTVVLALLLLWAAIASAHATVSATSPLGNNMVLQRDVPVPTWGTAAANKAITVTFNGQTKTTTSDPQGNWTLTLDPMPAKTDGSDLTISEDGGNLLTFSNVVVGDVWICSGQSNMAFNMGMSDRPQDVTTADFPGIRYMDVPILASGVPTVSFTGEWSVCSPSTAGLFSAVAFYFARKIYQDQNGTVPIGLIESAVSGTSIDPWLAPEGGVDIPVIAPIYTQAVMPSGPFSLFNGMIYPLAPFPFKGAIWYQGESRETTKQSVDSYFLKEKALVQGWKRVWGMNDLPFYIVQLAAYMDPLAGPDTAPDKGANNWPDTRTQQANILGLPHCGMASAIDIGDAARIHPLDKLDVGERLALWALKDEYGRATLVPCGPVLKDVTVSENKAICTFDYVGAGLMVGSKTPYEPTTELVGGTLNRFSISDQIGPWHDATANIVGDTVELSSPLVETPSKVAYAYWENPSGANLYNRDGLPASPFYVDDINAKYTVSASAGTGGSISPNGTSLYLKRKTALYTITPEAGFFVDDVTVDDVSIGAVKTYTFDPLYCSHSITATFARVAPEYTVAVSCGAGGSIYPSGISRIVQGGSQRFDISPSSNAVPNVLLDGVSIGPRRSLILGDVRNDHTISVTFTFSISASAGSGGTITSSGTASVLYGSDQTYTIAPLFGHFISDVKVDGQSVGPCASYTFHNISANHTISATFDFLVLGMNNATALTDEKALGKMVRVWGKVKSVTGTVSFTIDDGYGVPIDVEVNGATLPFGFGTDEMAVVTGILTDDRSILARDIVTL